VTDDPRPPPSPVAIRITRPFATEDELLEHEPDTITRTGVTLLGAQPRPQGVVLRFELTLTTGNPILRGEGRVVGYKPNMQDGLGGLTLRFTRLDSRSKSLVDKAATLREQRRQSLFPAASSIPPPPNPQPTPDVALRTSPSQRPVALPDPPTPPAAMGPAAAMRPAIVTAPVAAMEPVASMAPVSPASDVPLPLEPPSDPALPPASAPRPAEVAVEARRVPQPLSPRTGSAANGPVAAHPDRDALLGRLRSRARALDSSQVARILERK
jgi:hypothetical protein